MGDSTHTETAIVRGDGLNGSVPHVALQPSASPVDEMAAAQPKTAEAVREQAKTIAAAIAAKESNGNRATRRAFTKTVRTELPKSPVPVDPNCWLTPKKLIDKVLRALGPVRS